jgi:cyclic lactone autoinducer peptide
MKKVMKNFMNTMGCFALLLGVLAVGPNSTIIAQQPKCPDELLKSRGIWIY